MPAMRGADGDGRDFESVAAEQKWKLVEFRQFPPAEMMVLLPNIDMGMACVRAAPPRRDP
jgi:hypothetical protein